MVLLVLQTLALFYTLNKLEYVGAMDINRDSETIIQEIKADVGEIPYYAGLAGCGAAILSESWVLTAAHCFYSAPSYGNRVRVGGPQFSDSEVVAYDRVVYYGPKGSTYFGIDDPMNDIALVHLSEPLQFSDKIQPVELPSFKDLTRRGQVSTLELAVQGYNKDIEKIDVVRLSTQECLSYLPSYIQQQIQPFVSTLEKAIICAKPADGPGTRPGLCRNYSGSPLMDGNTLVGIASFTSGPCEDAKLALYVNVVSYVSWIKYVTGIE